MASQGNSSDLFDSDDDDDDDDDDPLPSHRQHLSYDVCLEVQGEIIRTVLCCIMYWSCAQS